MLLSVFISIFVLVLALVTLHIISFDNYAFAIADGLNTFITFRILFVINNGEQ